MPRPMIALAAATAAASPTLAFSPHMAPGIEAHSRRAAVAPRMGLFDGLLKGDSSGVVFKEWTHKGTIDGPKGAGLQGNVDVVFKTGDEIKHTRAFAGQPLSEVASQVDLVPRKSAARRCARAN